MFSIIIPVYNAADYLSACIKSIIDQQYSDFEVIMVDDGSTDNSSSICQNAVKCDNRFIYIYQDNGGVSCARNAGILRAKGDWILFMDADDMLMPNALEIYADLCARPHVDLGMGTYILESYIPKECYSESKVFDKTLSPEEMMELMFVLHKYNYQGYVWNKAFRTDIIRKHQLRFDTSVYMNEDRLFCVSYISKMCGSACFTSRSVYRYTKRRTGTVGLSFHTFNSKLLTDYESSLSILRILVASGFSQHTLNLAYDRIIESYDMIRHAVARTFTEEGTIIKKQYKRRTLQLVGLRYYVCFRIRRFLSKQYRSNLFGKKIS